MNNEEITSKVREILLTDWDPCGVGENDALTGEYDEYLPAIVALVKQQSSSLELDQTLAEFESELGIALPEQHRERVVQNLLAIRS